MGKVKLCWLAALLAVSPATASIPMTWFKGENPPLHPTVIFGTYKEKQLPIVAVHRDAGAVEVDGKLKDLSKGKDATFAPERANDYAPGSLTVADMQGGSHVTNLILMYEDRGDVNAGVVQANSDFSATVTPTQDYKDCFVALVFFDEGFLQGRVDSPGAMVEFRQLPDLAAGRPNKISFAFPYVDFGTHKLAYFPLFFTHGHEIRTNHADLIAKFFSKVEASRHEKIVERYRDKNRPTGKNAPPQLYLRVPPLFPDPTALNDAPPQVDVSFMVSEDGTVESVQFTQQVPPDVAHVLRPTLSAWRFLPRLKGGIAARTMVEVPIVLKKEGAAK